MRFLLYEAFNARAIDSVINKLSSDDRKIFFRNLVELSDVMELSKIPKEAIEYGRIGALKDYDGKCNNPTTIAQKVFYFDRNNKLIYVEKYTNIDLTNFSNIDVRNIPEEKRKRIPKDTGAYLELPHLSPVLMYKDAEIVPGIIFIEEDRIYCIQNRFSGAKANGNYRSYGIYSWYVAGGGNGVEYIDKGHSELRLVTDFKMPIEDQTRPGRSQGFAMQWTRSVAMQGSDPKENAVYYLSINFEKMYDMGLFGKEKKKLRELNSNVRPTDVDIRMANYNRYMIEIFKRNGITPDSEVMSLGKIVRKIMGDYPMWLLQNPDKSVYSLGRMYTTILNVIKQEIELSKLITEYEIVIDNSESYTILIPQGIERNANFDYTKRMIIMNNKLRIWINSLKLNSIADFNIVMLLLRNISNMLTSLREKSIQFYQYGLHIDIVNGREHIHSEHKVDEQLFLNLEQYVDMIINIKK